MISLLIIAAIVALVWCGVIFLRGGLVCGALAVLVSAACFGHPFFHASITPMPVTIDRMLWLLLVVQFVVWQRFGWVDPKPMGKVEWLLLVLIGVLGVSTFSHDWRVDGTQPIAWLFFYYLMPLGLYWVARQAAWSERDALILFGVLAAFGVYLAVTAFAETREWWWLVYPKYIATDDGGFQLGRGRGPFLNPSACGLYQGTCLCALLMWWPRVGRAGKLVVLAAAMVGFVGIYCTLTRSAWLGGFLGLLIVAGLTLPRRLRLPLVAGSLLVASLLLVTQFDKIMAFKRDKDLSAQAAADSVELRPVLAMVAWKMFRDRPLLGHGFGQYNTAKVYYLHDRSLQMPLEKDAAVPPAQCLPQPARRDRPAGDGNVRHRAADVDARRLAVGPLEHRATLVAASGIAVPGTGRQLPGCRYVSGCGDHALGPSAAVLTRRSDRRGAAQCGATRVSAGYRHSIRTCRLSHARYIVRTHRSRSARWRREESGTHRRSGRHRSLHGRHVSQAQPDVAHRGLGLEGRPDPQHPPPQSTDAAFRVRGRLRGRGDSCRA